MNPTVSVILSIYNVAVYIEKCLLSLLSQTYKDIELILVDDCSPDNSVELAVSLLERYRFTQYTLIRHQINSGAAAGRNSGLEAARGAYIYFIDNDDYAEPTILEDLLMPFANEEVDIVLCNFWRVYSETGNKEIGFTSPFDGKTKPLTALKALLTDKEHAYVWRCLYRRKLFETIRFAEGVPVEDMMTTPLLWATAKQLYFIPNLLYNYVQRPGSVMVNWKNVERWYNIPKFMVRNEAYYKSTDFLTPLYSDMLVYHYTMLRNYSLRIVQGEREYSYYQPLMEKYRSHIKLAGLLRLSSFKHLKLVVQLLVLKAGTHLFWKKYRLADVKLSNIK